MPQALRGLLCIYIKKPVFLPAGSCAKYGSKHFTGRNISFENLVNGRELFFAPHCNLWQMTIFEHRVELASSDVKVALALRVIIPVMEYLMIFAASAVVVQLH